MSLIEQIHVKLAQIWSYKYVTLHIYRGGITVKSSTFIFDQRENIFSLLVSYDPCGSCAKIRKAEAALVSSYFTVLFHVFYVTDFRNNFNSRLKKLD